TGLRRGGEGERGTETTSKICPGGCHRLDVHRPVSSRPRPLNRRSRRMTMQTLVSTRIRLGAVALGLATFPLALFPLVRPFFALDVFEPERGIALASPAFVSTAWTGSHYLAMLGFVLLQLGLLGLYRFP